MHAASDPDRRVRLEILEKADGMLAIPLGKLTTFPFSGQVLCWIAPWVLVMTHPEDGSLA